MAIKVIHVEPEFVDERGIISRVVDEDKNHIKFRAVLLITGRAGTVRGSHYHKKDSHAVYCYSGKFRYSEKNMKDEPAAKESVILEAGDMVISRPMIAHSMEFIEDSVFFAITTEPREQDKYEEDTVRLKF